MRRINLRFLLGTILLVLVLAGGVHAVHVLQYGKHADTWKALAETAKQNDNDAQQIDYLRRYTALRKNDFEAFEDLGNLLMKNNRYREAQLPLATALSAYQAREQATEARRVQRAQVKLALGIGQFKDAEVLLESLIDPLVPAGTVDPEQAEFREQHARCLMAVGEWRNAKADLEAAIQLDPARCDAYALLAEIEAAELGDPQSAVERINAMVDVNPDAAAAYQHRARFRLAHLNEGPVRAAEAARLQKTPAAQPTATELTAVELLTLASGDAAEALKRAEDDLATLQLSMNCAHLLSDVIESAQGEDYRNTASTLANRALSVAEAQLQDRLQAYQERQSPTAAPDGKDGGATPETAPPRPAVPADIVKRYTREIFAPIAPAYSVLASLAARSGDTDQAVTLLDEGLARVGRDENLLLLLASLKIAATRESVGAADISPQLQMLRQRREAEPLARYLEARNLMAQGRWAAALKELEGVKDSLTSWPVARSEALPAIATCQLKLGQYQLAQRTYEEILRNNPESVPAQLGLAMMLDRASRSGASYSLYQDIVARRGIDPADPAFPELFVGMLRSMLARSISRGDQADIWDEPSAFISEIRAKASALGDALPPAAREAIDIAQAELDAARKDFDAAEKLLTAALEQNPRSTASWIALSTVRDAAGQWEAAEDALRQAHAAIGASDPAQVALLKLSEAKHQLYQLSDAIRKGAVDSGESTMESVRARLSALYDEIPPIGTVPQIELERYSQAKHQYALLCLSLGDTATATRIYEDISRQDPGNLQSLVSLLELTWQRQERTADVTTVLAAIDPILAKVQELEGTDGPVWNFADATRLSMRAAALVGTEQAAERRKLLETALARLRTAERSWQGAERVRRLRAYIFRQQDRLTDAVDLELDVARDASAAPDADFINRLVQDLYRLRRFEEAAEVLSNVNSEVTSQLLNLAPTAMLVSGEVSDPAQARKLRELAVQLSQARAEEAEDFRSKVAHGMMLLRAEDRTGAREQFEAARDMATDEPQPWLALIELDVLEGKLDNARQTVERAAQSIRESDRPIALARAYNLVGDHEQSRQHVAQALAEIPQDLTKATPLQVEVLLRASEAYAQWAEFEENQARQLAEKQPETARQHHEAAVKFDAVGLELLERLARDGALARSTLAAAGKTPDPARPEDDAKPDAAADLLTQLNNLLPVVNRRLALVLYSKGGSANRERALRVLDANLVAAEFRPEDARLRAMILSQSPAHADKEQALATVQKLIRESSTPRNEDRLLAGSLHLSEYRRRLADAKRAVGNDPDNPPQVDQETRQHLDDAVKLFNDIIVVHQSTPRPRNSDGKPVPGQSVYLQALVTLIEILMDKGDIDQAEIYVGQLTQAAPESQTTLGAITAIHFQRGHVDAAVEAARRFADSGPDEERAARRLNSSRMLEGFGQRAKDEAAAETYFSEAEQLLVEVSADQPASDLLLAGYRARRGHAEDAIAAIEAHATDRDDIQLTSASVHAMRAAGTDHALLRRLKAALQTAHDAKPESAPLKLMLADLYTWLGDLDPAEQMYRDVLSRYPKHAAAANNLAFLLASRRRPSDESLELINGVIAEQGPLAELLDTRAYVQLTRGDSESAVKDLTRAIAEVSQPTYLYHQAQALLALNRMQEAKAAWALATRQGLSESSLHPLERAEYRELAAKLGDR